MTGIYYSCQEKMEDCKIRIMRGREPNIIAAVWLGNVRRKRGALSVLQIELRVAFGWIRLGVILNA